MCHDFLPKGSDGWYMLVVSVANHTMSQPSLLIPECLHRDHFHIFHCVQFIISCLSLDGLQCEAPQDSQVGVHITPISMVYGTQITNYSYWGSC